MRRTSPPSAPDTRRRTSLHRAAQVAVEASCAAQARSARSHPRASQLARSFAVVPSPAGRLAAVAETIESAYKRPTRYRRGLFLNALAQPDERDVRVLGACELADVCDLDLPCDHLVAERFDY